MLVPVLAGVKNRLFLIIIGFLSSDNSLPGSLQPPIYFILSVVFHLAFSLQSFWAGAASVLSLLSPLPLTLTYRALQEAQEIFGVDFDYDEFEKYNEYDEELEEDYEYEDDETEGEIRVRPKKTTKKRVSRRSIFEMYEPSELESSHLTDQDNEIRATDLPERFQVRTTMSSIYYGL
jgi:hypothetical protein